jgi:hypothetical protein
MLMDGMIVVYQHLLGCVEEDLHLMPSMPFVEA